MQKNNFNNISFLYFIFSIFSFFSVSKGSYSISCFLNLQGDCNKGSTTINNFNVNDYIHRYNIFTQTCNMNPKSNGINSEWTLPYGIDNIMNTPCIGVIPPFTINYNYSKQCGLIEAYSTLQQCLNNNLQKMNTYYNNLNILNYTIILYNLPINCPFYGLGTTQIYRKYSVIWLQTSRLTNYNLSNTLAHEMAHTKGIIYHSGTFGSTWEYSDCSCIMGCASSINVCFNAPVSNMLGWSKPYLLNPLLSNKNKWIDIFIPIYTRSLYNHIIIPIPNSESECQLYFSIRSSDGRPDADSGISGLFVVNINNIYSPVENSLSIHAMNNTQKIPKAVDFLIANLTNIWDFSQFSEQVCGKTNINIAIKHKYYSNYISGGGSLVSFCFYDFSNKMCII